MYKAEIASTRPEVIVFFISVDQLIARVYKNCLCISKYCYGISQASVKSRLAWIVVFRTHNSNADTRLALKSKNNPFIWRTKEESAKHS